MGREGREVVSDILRTFVSERLQITNVSWRSRSKLTESSGGAGWLSCCRGVLAVKNRTDMNTKRRLLLWRNHIDVKFLFN